MSGIQNSFSLPADVPITSSVALTSLNLGGTGGFPIAANQKLKIRYWVKVTVGATGGIRAQVVVPGSGTSFQATIRLNNTVAPSSTIAAQQASAAFTNALANAGTHWIEIEVYVQNGATAGRVDLQVAQNTSDALTATFLKGASMDVTSF